MDYKSDTIYKEKVDRLLQHVKELEDNLSDNVDELKDEANREESKLSTSIQKKWEGVQSQYHDLMIYLKDTFNVDHDKIAEHRVKQLSHKAKELGLDLKLKAMKATS